MNTVSIFTFCICSVVCFIGILVFQDFGFISPLEQWRGALPVIHPHTSSELGGVNLDATDHVEARDAAMKICLD
ncbi:uncharacterized protein EI90DRAFT_3090528 [Cantharellus anzutake]|uniref:uncharacterized protein n=1 Tax=Cantharellus anzutake TaxID=1750568 RepID=UPI001905A2A8|nr:uncharacterized protein EI90DRAFT_3090528 [Cantharellus anzutake]KAF8314368.1 hypothetical protein EI90DRAFT_3090528 [Cantharellus anzutake]